MKRKTILKIAALLAGLLNGVTATAADLNVTAEFIPDPTNAGHNEFVNTTPMSGFCQIYPRHCPNMFSLRTSLTVTNRTLDQPSPDMRHWAYQGLDSGRKMVRLTEVTTGLTINATFRLSLLSQKYNRYSSPFPMSDWYSAGTYPQGGCNGTTGLGDTTNYMFAWVFPEGVTSCYRRPYSGITGKTADVADISVGYILQLTSPLRIPSGDYVGSVEYSVGNGAQIDVGEGVYNDNRLVINISARVQHALEVSHITNGGRAQLQPPGGWARWQQGGALPERLIAETGFRLSVSGPFEVSMRCEYPSGIDQCALKNDANGEEVSVSTRITLPEVTNQSTNTRAEDMPLQPNAPPIRLYTDRFIIQQRSAVKFEVGRADTQRMLLQPGSLWHGGVTLVFDAPVP